MIGGALAFLVTVSFWPGTLSAAVAPRWALLAVGVPLSLWFVPRLWTPGLTPWLLAGLGYAALTLLWSPDSLGGTNLFAHLALFSGAAILGAQVANLRPLLLGMAAGITVTAPLVAAQWLGYSPVEQHVLPAGLFYNRNVLAELVAPLMLYTALSVRGVNWNEATSADGRSIWIAVFLALILAASIDRAALLGVVIVAACLLPFAPRVLVVLGGTVLLAGLTIYSSWGLESVSVRLDILFATLREFAPWGRGLGSFQEMFPHWEYAHCDPLQLLFEIGPGAVPFFIVVLRALRRGDRTDVAAFAALACLVVESCFSMPLFLPTSVLLSGLLVGRLYAAGVVVRDGVYAGGGAFEVGV